MNIAIDIRPLLDDNLTGVGEYTLQLLTKLLKIDTANQYFLFYNSYSRKPQHLHLTAPNITYCEFNYPNKIFNFLLLNKKIELDTLINKKYSTKIDIFFFPNISFIHTSSECKNIVTVHDVSFMINPEWFSFKRKIWHKVINLPRIIDNAEHIICVSENTAQDVQKYFKPQNLSVTHLGISPELKRITNIEKLQNTRNQYTLPNQFILYLATLEPRKNIPTLIDAFNQITTDHHLVLAGGNGWKNKHIYKAIERSPKRKLIHVIGYINPEHKASLYSLANLFVFPSYYEGFGLPPLEAAACECPIIASTGSSLEEILHSAAQYINPYSNTQLALTIEEVLKNHTLQKQMISQGQIIASKFNWDITAEQTLHIFQSIKK